jgi:hypothetical protein
MELQEYFQLPHTPSKHSPVGFLMVNVLAKNPGMSFDDARTEANRLLDRAAGRKIYSMPRVLSPSQKLDQKTKLAAFASSKTAQTSLYDTQR